jgi:hypothetical protein
MDEADQGLDRPDSGETSGQFAAIWGDLFQRSESGEAENSRPMSHPAALPRLDGEHHSA